MRGLVRLLVMFGPMIFRQFQKMQRNKARQQPRQYPDRQLPRDRRSNRDKNYDRGVRRNRDGEYDRGATQNNTRADRGEYVEYKDLNKELGIDPKAEEKIRNLKEEEIMLDKEDLRHVRHSQPIAEVDLSSLENEPLDLQQPAEKAAPKKDNDGFNIRDLFVEDIDENE